MSSQNRLPAYAPVTVKAGTQGALVGAQVTGEYGRHAPRPTRMSGRSSR